jgi:putative ATP-binding cassette transporter
LQKKSRLSRIALSYWLSRDSLQAWTLTLLVIICTIIIVLLNMLLNKWQVGFYEQLQNYSSRGFIDSLVQFLLFSVILAFTAGNQSCFRMRLEIRWRSWLTNQYISLWLQNKAYYYLQFTGATTNPEQRISEDVRLFITASLDLAVGLLRHTVALIVFSFILWNLSGVITWPAARGSISIPGYLLWLALLYSAIGTWLTLRIGKPLVQQNILQQTHEAEFRSQLTQISEQEECIALYRGEAAETRYLANQFRKIFANFLAITDSTKTLTIISSVYSQFSIVFAFLAASPRYFSGDMQLGQLFEISGAYWYVHAALSYIIESFGKFALWQAVACRLNSFGAQLSRTRQLNRSQGNIDCSSRDQFKLQDLTILSATKQPLLDSLSLELKAQEKLLINGPSGSGKTTLLRTIAGLWPYFTGAITRPEKQAVIFLPQKPYIPSGSLRNALLYPALSREIPEQRMNEVLECCNLSKLIGKLEQVEHWSKILSLGEQQCMTFARVLLQQPDWLFLDEATSSLDKKAEAHLYSLLTNQLPKMGFVSVGHRETLQAFHARSVTLDGSGAWQIAALRDSRLTRRQTYLP